MTLWSVREQLVALFAGPVRPTGKPQGVEAAPNRPNIRTNRRAASCSLTHLQTLPPPAGAWPTPSFWPLYLISNDPPRYRKQARIVSHLGFYMMEIVYEQHEAAPFWYPALSAAVDFLLLTPAALTSNKVGFVPRLVHGSPTKSTNQSANKRPAELQATLD